jgi:hypothetical protein
VTLLCTLCTLQSQVCDSPPCKFRDDAAEAVWDLMQISRSGLVGLHHICQPHDFSDVLLVVFSSKSVSPPSFSVHPLLNRSPRTFFVSPPHSSPQIVNMTAQTNGTNGYRAPHHNVGTFLFTVSYSSPRNSAQPLTPNSVRVCRRRPPRQDC